MNTAGTAHVLAADIGGTNSRFAAFSLRDGQLALEATVWIPTAEARSFSELFELLAARDFPLAVGDAAACVLAVPGAVKGGSSAKPPNIGWEIDAADIPAGPGAPARLINDFVAQAYACRTPVVDAAKLLFGGNGESDGVRAAIGAGTGLGNAALLPDGCGGWTALASETGHAPFGMRSGEREFEDFLLAESGQPYAVGDLIVSGRGLAWVHQYLTGDKLSPAEVAAVLGEHPDTVEWFARFYGRAARNYALAVVALGGVFLMGGVAAKNPRLVTHQAFQSEFVDSPKYGWLLETIPVRLVDNEDSGLWGSAFLAGQLLHAGS